MKTQTEKTAYELSKEASEILKEAKYGIWGEEKTREKYLQSRFEYSFPTAPFSGKSRRGKWKKNIL